MNSDTEKWLAGIASVSEWALKSGMLVKRVDEFSDSMQIHLSGMEISDAALNAPDFPARFLDRLKRVEEWLINARRSGPSGPVVRPHSGLFDMWLYPSGSVMAFTSYPPHMVYE